MIRKIRIFWRSFAIAGNAGRIAKFAFTHKKETKFLAGKTKDFIKMSPAAARKLIRKGKELKWHR